MKNIVKKIKKFIASLDKESVYLSQPISFDEVEYFLRYSIHGINKLATSYISPVKCPVTFGGYGYVQGRKKALKISLKIKVVEADNDMEFTCCCVLINSIPTLIVQSHAHRGATIEVIGEVKDYLLDILEGRPRYKFNDELEWETLPTNLQNVMKIVVKGMNKAHMKLHNNVSLYEQDEIDRVKALINSYSN